MQTFKIEHFERRYGVPFPQFRALSVEACKQVREKLGERVCMPSTTSPIDLVKALDGLQERLPNVTATDPSFDLAKVLPIQDAERGQSVLVNWYRFDEIDEIEAGVLTELFTDVWYPTADDIDIMDIDISWVVSVRYDGVVKRIRFT